MSVSIDPTNMGTMVANVLQGDGTVHGTDRFGIVVARFNESITTKLLEGALRTLSEAGVAGENVDVCWVPGAWEIPVVARNLVSSNRYVAAICLGAVIRGETTHDQYINMQVSRTLGQLAAESGIPVLFGLLTCNTLEQAIHRSGGDVGNKGVDCAKAAMEMAALMRQIRERNEPLVSKR